MFYSNHLSLSIISSTTSELPIAVSPCSIACSGPGAQRYGEMDERMSRKRPHRYSESGVMVQYIPHRVRLKPNRSRALPGNQECKGMPLSLA
jgi:hypothetical protein